MSKNHSRERKVTRAFKIDETLDREIADQARKIGITPSSLVSQVLRGYTEWGRYTGKGTNFVTIDTEIFKSFIQELDEEKIIEIARSSALVETHNFLKFRFQRIDPDTVLKFIEVLSSNANIGEASVIVNDDSYEINLRHSLGVNWSVFLSEYIQGMLSSFLEMRTTAEVSPFGCSVTARK